MTELTWLAAQSALSLVYTLIFTVRSIQISVHFFTLVICWSLIVLFSLTFLYDILFIYCQRFSVWITLKFPNQRLFENWDKHLFASTAVCLMHCFPLSYLSFKELRSKARHTEFARRSVWTLLFLFRWDEINLVSTDRNDSCNCSIISLSSMKSDVILKMSLVLSNNKNKFRPTTSKSVLVEWRRSQTLMLSR